MMLQPKRPLQFLQTLRLAAEARHRHRAHQARLPAAKRTPRTHALDALKRETARPPASNAIQQQERFDAFRHEFNAERPHEALAMKTPAGLYKSAPRAYQGLPEIEYPLHDRDILVTACGRICMHRKKIFRLNRARWSETRIEKKSTTPSGSSPS